MAPTGFVPLGSKARWIVLLLAATIVVDAVGALFDLWEIHLMTRILDGRAVTAGSLDDSDNRQAADGLADVVLLIATAIVFIGWFSAAYRNTNALGASGHRLNPGWAIGAWFVPILNLWRPLQIAEDTWRASDPSAPRDQGADWLRRPADGLVRLWWITWIAASLIGTIGARSLFRADTASEIRATDTIDAFAFALEIVAAALAIVVVRRLTRRQDDRRLVLERAERLTAVGA